MPSLKTLAKRGLVSEAVVHSANVGPDGVVHRINYGMDWCGVNGFGNAQEGDILVYISVTIRTVKVHYGVIPAKEDLPKVFEAVDQKLANE